ncbi:hypothetical protein CRUP_032499 [Coryphaenoides rupestris]|nr:hypothetical protein CRUP_032499 [Coryphaenoides rupestris]
MAEKDRLLRELDTCQERLRKARSGMEDRPGTGTHRGGAPGRQLWCDGAPVPLPGDRTTGPTEPQRGAQAHRLAEMYREQCISMETELSQIREEGDVGREIFKEWSDKMAKRLQLMTQRYEALEKRRSMEAEGFKVDLKLHRQKLKDVEKQLVKVTRSVGPNQDLAILHEVKQTNSRTKKYTMEVMAAMKASAAGMSRWR